MLSEPFTVASLASMINEDFIQALIADAAKTEFFEKSNDLYQFSQVILPFKCLYDHPESVLQHSLTTYARAHYLQSLSSGMVSETIVSEKALLKLHV